MSSMHSMTGLDLIPLHTPGARCSRLDGGDKRRKAIDSWGALSAWLACKLAKDSVRPTNGTVTHAKA